ncbi:hypothetical protein ACH79_42510 [Bradyrhizobium sp. CCBAU 051011]|uniref:hypothetical protein n=1 Tax=Bradyrhizobium sp. CCBAU 051011 TaxID=858422 RepID=UPI00137429DE|nr:hypothetical protein [Bradyrhizobium sp. CCBAU 051011]QHO78274.1 hypothetical protein ACH79_42510 [Bradyrhizobium sp. CCBAU 051011]
MRWKKLGRIFVANAHSEWLHSHGIVPIARTLGDYSYRIYFSPRDRENRSNVSWLDIDIRDPTRILRCSDQPLLTPGPLGCFDDSGAMGCWIVENDGVERLYYQGWNLGATVSFHVAVGIAERPSGDPDRPFERISAGPVLDRCMQEPVFIADPAVLIENGRWRMWYQSGRPWRQTATNPLPSYDIRYAESPDGVRWDLAGVQSLTFEHPGEVAIARFCPLRENDGSYKAWYSYRADDWGYRIGMAISKDGIKWARRDDEAGIERDPEGWEGSMICYPFVFDTEIGRMMLYNGGRYGDAGFGIAALERD